MADVAYSIKITLESVKVKDPDDGDVYFIASINGSSLGRSKIFDMKAGDTADLKPLGWSREVRVLGSPSPIKIELGAWDHDKLSKDDDLGALSVSVSSPWKERKQTVTSSGGNLELTFTVGVTKIELKGAATAVVSRQYDGSTYVSTLARPNVAVATFTEILGLNKPGADNRPVKDPGTTRGSDYVKGYLSEDDKGRIFVNRKPDGTWDKGKQYIELTAVVEPAWVKLPAGAKMVWSFEDPDDPTNEPPNVHPDAGKILDPNDYAGAAKVGAKDGDNDPNGKGKAKPKFEEIDPKFALSGAETLIDVPTRTTKVRFHVSDIAGDNFKVKAEVKADPTIDLTLAAETGVMTVWSRIDLEYVKMKTAAELPVDQISAHYDMACVQVDVSLKREVTGASDLPQMGKDDNAAGTMCDDYATKAKGEFTMEGKPGWFFIVAARRFLPSTKTKILYEGPAEVQSGNVRLPKGTTLASTPVVVRVFEPAKIVGAKKPKPNDHNTHIKFSIKKKTGLDLILVAHDFHEVDNPDVSFLDATLKEYGFADGTAIEVQVLTDGDDSLITAGISPGGADIGGKHFFGGRLLIFTESTGASEYLTVLCHELCHAFDNAHKCGNWDWKLQPNRTSCCMCYWFQFVLDDAAPRKAIMWTQNRARPDLCAQHIRHMRDYHLEDNPGLGW